MSSLELLFRDGLEDICWTGSLVWNWGSCTASFLGLGQLYCQLSLTVVVICPFSGMYGLLEASAGLLSWFEVHAASLTSSQGRVPLGLFFRLFLSFLAFLLKFLEGSCSTFYSFLTDWRATSDEMLS